MFKCPNKNLPEWKELEKVVPEVAYTIWDMNNGYGIDKAPNGEPSVLFLDLLLRFNNDRDAAILEKAKTFSNSFKTASENMLLDQNGEPNINDVIAYNTVLFNPEEFNIPDQDALRELKRVSGIYDKIIGGLKDRLSSVKRYSTKNPKVWNLLLTLISLLTNAEAEQGIFLFLEHINDTVQDSIKFLDKPIESINAKQIRQLSVDYVGFYKPLVDDIISLLDTTDIFKGNKDYEYIKLVALDASRMIDLVNNRFENVLKRKGYFELSNYLRNNGMPEAMILETLNWLDDPKHDSSVFMNWFGMASNSNNPVQLAIAKMLNDTKNATDRETMNVGIKLVKKLNKAKEKYGNDVQKLLYEKLNDGTYSGNITEPINWGLMNKDRLEFIDTIAKKLGITDKDENGMYILPLNEDIQRKWYSAINDWYSDRAERRFKLEYYDLRNRILSMKTRDAVREIDDYINNITLSITIDGVLYENLLSEAEYNSLLQLRKLKKLLSNKFNLDGSAKTGTDKVIAYELSEFNEKAGDNIKYTIDEKRYNADRKKVVNKYGEGSAQLKLWEERNTVTRYNLAFYDRIDALDKDPINSKEDSLYQRLKKHRREIHQLYKDPKTGKIDANSLTDAEKQALLKLDLDVANAYVNSPKENTQDKDKFSNFAQITTTELYDIDALRARDIGPEAYNLWFNDNHYEDSRGNMQPASYYTELRPLDALRDMYVEVVPSSKYSTIDESSNWYNSKFDNDGPSILPSLKYYDNRKAYEAITSKTEVKELYDEIKSILSEAKSYINFLLHSNDTRMPLIEARFMQALSRKDGILDRLKYIFEDVALTKEDDTDFVKEFSTMPNGDPIKVIPTRFITRLDDPNSISTDAVASVVQFYNMAANYKNMSNKRDDIELMLNLLKLLSIRTKKELKGPGSTNIYKQSELLVDRLLYGRNKTQLIAELGGLEINYGKTLDLVRGFITKVNLSGNLWSIGTSFFTDTTYTTLEAKMGRYFDSEDLHFAIGEFTRRLPDMMSNIGNPDPKGKLPYLLMLNQVVKDNKELFDRLDQSQVLRSINLNFWFAGYTLADYTVKSHTLLSIYHNYRFVENEGFLSKKLYLDKYYPTDRKRGEVAFKQLDTTLYDAYIENSDGTVSINQKYAKYINDKLLNDVKNRIEILSKRIDGTLREVDKAAIHANSIASYLVLHRNFMISSLHDRFKNKLYNLDLGAIEEGYYRSTGRFLKNVIGNRHFALSLILADYDNMEEYEQYAVRRTLNEMLLIAASSVVAVSLAAIVDGDDDYDNWLTLSITYLAMRSAFEFRTMYNPFEFLALIKSPTAAFNWFDSASSFINLVNPLSYVGDRTPFTIIDRGVYKGMPVILKNIIKVTPFKSIIEAQDPKSKRNYLLNQLMNF